MVHSYSNTDTDTALCYFLFILTKTSDFHIIDKLLIAFYIFARRMLQPISVEKILLMCYVNLSTNFRNLPLNVEMVSSRL